MSLTNAVADDRAKPSSAAARLLRRAEWLLDALTDPTRRERSIIAVLAGYVAIWTLYAVLAKASQDIHHDVAQLVAWSREPGFGYNHPPLAVWIVTVWFWIFPLADWAAYLLASVNVALTLWICWKLFGDWLDPVKRVVALAMLTLVPLYTFHALIYNANSAMLPVWAAATLFFLRAYKTRTAGNAALAGLFAGAAIMVKYWSVFLLAGFGLAALIDTRRGKFWSSRAPWISAAVGLAVIAPHLIWLASGRTTTMDFAEWMLDHELSIGIGKSLAYLAAAVGYVALPLIIMVLLRPSRTALHDLLLPSDIDRRLVALLFWIPLLLPALANLAVPFRLTAVWSMPNWSLLPVLLLASPLVTVTRVQALRLLAFAMAVPAAVLVVSPFIAVLIHEFPAGDPMRRNAMLAREIDAVWRATTTKPMRLIGGSEEIVTGLSFYLADRPVPLQKLQPAPRSAGDRLHSIDEGAALVCDAQDRECLNAIKPFEHPATARREVTLARSFWGLSGPPVRYVILAVPPKR